MKQASAKATRGVKGKLILMFVSTTIAILLAEISLSTWCHKYDDV